MPAADDVAAFQQEQRARRQLAVDLTSHCLFIATVIVSHGIKDPMMHVFHWWLKQDKIYNKKVQGAVPYFGDTPLSQFVCEKAEYVNVKLGALLSDSTLTERWGTVWDLVPTNLIPAARQLIVMLALIAKASWESQKRLSQGGY